MLDPRTLEWVARAVGKGARVVGGRRLTGGITSSIHRLTVETRTGVRQQVVLRRWTPGARDDTADAPGMTTRVDELLAIGASALVVACLTLTFSGAANTLWIGLVAVGLALIAWGLRALMDLAR